MRMRWFPSPVPDYTEDFQTNTSGAEMIGGNRSSVAEKHSRRLGERFQ